MIKKYSRANEFTQDILDAQHTTFDRGWSCGWNIGDENISFKRGYTSYIYSHPGQGKTVFVTESLLCLAKNDNLNVCIYSPETGGRSEIVWNLIQVYTGKRLYGKNAHKISKDEIEKAIEFINKHFIILEHNPFSGKGNERFTVKDIFNQVHMAEKEYDMKIDVLCIDPFNLLDRELEDDRKAIQDYVLSTLGFINSASKKMNLHTILVAHLAGDELIVDKDTGIEYSPKPHPSKLAGGQSFWRAGFQMIGIWRLPYGCLDKQGFAYKENSMWIMTQKVKPIGTGRLGHFELYYDTNTHTLYETFGDKRFRCGEMNNNFSLYVDAGLSRMESSIKPNTLFDSKSEPDLTNPF
jgi:hypothetical protein